MNELGLTCSVALYANHSATSLIITSVRNRGNLLITVHRRNIYLNIISTRHRSRAILCRKLNRTEVETKSLYKVFCVCNKLLKSLVTLFGKSILNHLNLVELVTSYHSALVGAIASSLTTEARSIAYILSGKVCLGKYLISVQGNQSRFSRRKHKATALVLCGFKPVNVLCKFGELSCGKSALITKHMRNQNKLVAV